MQRRFYLLSTSLTLAAALAATSAMPAFAQSKGREEGDEIIVTAQKRDERLVDVPVSMSVFNDTAIEQTGTRQLANIAEYIPNVEISQIYDFSSQVIIRGVGSNSRNIGFDTRVGVYVDGVYVGQSPAINQELLDVEQVEVLRGPQGTFFGKDTVAGAVNIITKKPSDKMEGMIGVDVGNYNYHNISGMLNVPLGKKSAFKVSVAKMDRDGYIPNSVTGSELLNKDVLSYRAQLRVTPNDKFEANFSFDGLNAQGLVMLGEPFTDMLGLFPVPVDRVVDFTFDPHEWRDIYGGAMNLEYKMDSGYVLKSITGYRDTHALYANETDYSVADVIHIDYEDHYKQWSQEFQLISPNFERFNYVAGLYYYNQDADTRRDVILGQDFLTAFIAPFVAPSVAPLFGLDPNNLTIDQLALISGAVGFGPPGSLVYNSGNVGTESYAGYFNGNFNITERLKLGVGARYTIADKDVNWLLDGRNSGIFGIGSTGVPLGGTGTPTPLINNREDKQFDPMVSLTYALNEQSNIYAKYASGFKSGGFNLDYINAVELAANSGLEFDKETVDSYEVGYKASYDKFALNVSAFYAEYSNYQVNQFVDLGGGNTSIRITNAASVETKGIELDGILHVTDNLTFSGSMGLLDATFASFPGGGTAGADASGKKIPGSADFNTAVSMQYYQPLPAWNGRGLFRVDFTHRSGVFTTIDNTTTATYAIAPGTFPFGYVDPQDRLNARIGFLNNDGRFEVYLWGRNILDEEQYIDDFRDFFNTKVRFPGIGRTWGVEGKIRF